MFDIITDILSILHDMNEEIDQMSKHPNARTMGISRRIQAVRKELNRGLGLGDG